MRRLTHPAVQCHRLREAGTMMTEQQLQELEMRLHRMPVVLALIAEVRALRTTTSREEDHWYAKWVDERAALAEARRVLREISELLPCDTPCDNHDAAPPCPTCGHEEHVYKCAGCMARGALAAVLAQEEK